MPVQFGSYKFQELMSNPGYRLDLFRRDLTKVHSLRLRLR